MEKEEKKIEQLKEITSKQLDNEIRERANQICIE